MHTSILELMCVRNGHLTVQTQCTVRHSAVMPYNIHVSVVVDTVAAKVPSDGSDELKLVAHCCVALNCCA